MRRAEFGAATEHDVEIETSAGRRTSAIAIEAAANRWPIPVDLSLTLGWTEAE